MRVRWTDHALDDIERLYEFLRPVAPAAAAQVIQSLVAAAARLPENPRIGYRLDAYDPREVRRVIVGRYEVRYEIADGDLYILRLWHTREDRAKT